MPFPPPANKQVWPLQKATAETDLYWHKEHVLPSRFICIPPRCRGDSVIERQNASGAAAEHAD
jgi:hypothetical protein